MPYRNATSGMVEWKAVSNTPTWGMSSPSSSWTARMPLRLAGLCSGARSMHSSMPAITPGSMRTESLNFSPPWTSRWPTPWMSANERTESIFDSEDTIQRRIRSIAARWSRNGASVLRAGWPSASKVMIAWLPMRSISPRARQRSVS